MNEIYPIKVPDVPAILRLRFRQKQVISLMAGGLKNKEIAEEMGLSLKSVEWHRAKVKKIFGAKTTADLMLKYFKEKMLYE